MSLFSPSVAWRLDGGPENPSLHPLRHGWLVDKTNNPIAPTEEMGGGVEVRDSAKIKKILAMISCKTGDNFFGKVKDKMCPIRDAKCVRRLYPHFGCKICLYI